jgi:hypothetical protein
MATQQNLSRSNPRSKLSATIIRRLRSYRLPRTAVPTGKPDLVILMHAHVCAACKKLRPCNARPCWLRYRSHRRQWEWTCPDYRGPAPAAAQPIAA